MQKGRSTVQIVSLISFQAFGRVQPMWS